MIFLKSRKVNNILYFPFQFSCVITCHLTGLVSVPGLRVKPAGCEPNSELTVI
jgi:hypothetical protein